MRSWTVWSRSSRSSSRLADDPVQKMVYAMCARVCRQRMLVRGFHDAGPLTNTSESPHSLVDVRQIRADRDVVRARLENVVVGPFDQDLTGLRADRLEMARRDGLSGHGPLLRPPELVIDLVEGCLRMLRQVDRDRRLRRIVPLEEIRPRFGAHGPKRAR